MRALLLAVPLVLATAASGQGRLAFDAEAVDLGRVPEGETPTHTFRFTNTGDAPLSLSEVDVACGCTTLGYTEAAVAPGETGTVDVTYDTAGRPGPFEKAVYVHAAGAEPAATTLRVTGTVVPALAVDGVRLGALAFDATEADVGTLPPEGDRGYQQAFRFANVGERPVRIDSVSAPAGVEVTFPDRPIFPDGVGGLYVIADDYRTRRLTSGHGFETDIVLYTDDPEAPEKRLRVTGTVEVLESRNEGLIHVNE